MPRFFCDPVQGETARILGEDARHLSRVFRLRVGERLTLCDLRGFDYQAEAVSVCDEEVVCRVLSKMPNETEPSVKITLYQALPKGDKMEWILQKAVELGVSRVVPVETRFCVAKADPKNFEKKRERYRKIVKEAAKQSGRGMIPEVSGILKFEEALHEMQASEGARILFYEKGGRHVSELVRPEERAVSILIGSEGGFSEEEARACADAGIALGSLGRRILRCETAPLAALTLLLAVTNNL